MVGLEGLGGPWIAALYQLDDLGECSLFITLQLYLCMLVQGHTERARRALEKASWKRKHK